MGKGTICKKRPIAVTEFTHVFAKIPELAVTKYKERIRYATIPMLSLKR